MKRQIKKLQSLFRFACFVEDLFYQSEIYFLFVESVGKADSRAFVESSVALFEEAKEGNSAVMIATYLFKRPQGWSINL